MLINGRLFPTSVVGSMPPPQWVRDLLRLKTRGEWSEASAEICGGFEVSYRGEQPCTVVTEPISSLRPVLTAKEGLFVRRNSQCEVKVALPSPYLLGQRMWSADRSAAAYPTRESFMRDLVPVLRSEVEALRDAGIRNQFEDPVREMDLCVDLLNEIMDGFEDMTTAIHLCRRNKGREGWIGEGGYEPIREHLRRLKVKVYMLEFAIPAAGDFDVLEKIPEDRYIGIGCVDCRNPHTDKPEEIVGRVKKALEHTNPERVFLHPDCGFAPGSAADIPIDEAYLKLKNLALAGEILRDLYG